MKLKKKNKNRKSQKKNKIKPQNNKPRKLKMVAYLKDLKEWLQKKKQKRKRGKRRNKQYNIVMPKYKKLVFQVNYL